MLQTTTFKTGLKLAPALLPDASLLDEFLARRDESAFEELLRRHGPAVLRVCRRHLGAGQDAEDAFQATFLVLTRRAEAIRRIDDVGYWLRGVARRISTRARIQVDRDRSRKGAIVDFAEVAGPEEPDHDDLRPALRAEVERLPEKYRRPIELCYWEGLSNDQAAERLDCPTGTVKWRLSRARELLRDRCLRRGIAMSVLLLFRTVRAEAASSELSTTNQGDLPTPLTTLTDELIRQTTVLAEFVRDLSPSILEGASMSSGGSGTRSRRGRLARLATIGLIAAGVTLSSTL